MVSLKKREVRGESLYFFTIEKMMSCVPDAVCSSSAIFAKIEIKPNPKSIPVVTVTVSPAGMSIAPFSVLLKRPRMPPCT